MADDTPKAAFTPEQIETLTSMMGTTVNNIFTARLASQEKKTLEKIPTLLAEALKSQLPDVLKEFQPAPADDKKGRKGSGDDVETATLKKQLADLAQRVETETAGRKAERSRNREMIRQRQMLDDLAKGGITEPFKQELALAYLDKNGRVSYSTDDDDAVLIWNDPATGAVTYQEGIGGWLKKSEEAKHFLPPTGVRGAGSFPYRNSTQTSGQKPTTAEQHQIVAEAFQEAWNKL